METGDHMEKIESFTLAYQYLKEQQILCRAERGGMTFYGMRGDKVHVQGSNVHYVLDPDDFIHMFHQETFYLYEKKTPVEISKEKDDEYYSWQHK